MDREGVALDWRYIVIFNKFKQEWKESWEFKKQGWRLLKNNFNYRYWLLFGINISIVLQVALWLERILDLGQVLLYVAVVAVYIASPLTMLLWVPQYIKEKKPQYYQGAIRVIGEWLGPAYKHKK